MTLTPEQIEAEAHGLRVATYACLMQIAVDSLRAGKGPTFVVLTELGLTVVHDQTIAYSIAEGLPRVLPISNALVISLDRLAVKNAPPTATDGDEEPAEPNDQLEGDDGDGIEVVEAALPS